MAHILAGHILRNDTGDIVDIQPLVDHSRNVAQHCAALCQRVGLKSLGYLIGWLHDLGKAHHLVQEHMYNNTPEKLNHAGAGMRWLWVTFSDTGPWEQLAAQLAALAIGFHHRERPDVYAPDGTEPWRDRMDSAQALALYEESCSVFFANCISEQELSSLFSSAVKEVKQLCQQIAQYETSCGTSPIDKPYQMQLGLIQRYLFAALVDADWSDTASFFNHTFSPVSEDLPPWDMLADRVDAHIKGFLPRHPIDTLRREISDQCAASGQNAAPGIYRLYLPTGGGKTLSGLRYCIQAAKHRQAKRIFYFAPFRSIIGQNTKVFQDALGGAEFLLEHHSDIIATTQSEAQLRQMERWQDVPVISTTLVQFLNTLFAAPRQNVRRMAGLADSILFFDEIQSLPLCHTYLFNTAVNFLANCLHCTIILCTATQPALEIVQYPLHYAVPQDIVPDYALRFAQFHRTEIVPVPHDGGFTAEALADFVLEKAADNRSMLVILNTRAAVDAVFTSIKNSAPPDFQLFCLTTHLCPRHRQDIIDTIRARLETPNSKKLICVSTQLIEAGVDLSFDCVVRSMAALPSVAQAAGRCNRHAEVNCRPVYLVGTEPHLERLENLPDLDNGRQAMLALLHKLPKGTDLLSPESIVLYYKIYFGSYHQTDRMGDPVRLEGDRRYTDLFDLFTTNDTGVSACRRMLHTRAPLPFQLHQAFSTAESHFHALESIITPVIVPYGNAGKELIAKLQIRSDISTALLHEAQPFSVGVTDTEMYALQQNHALLPAAGGSLWILQDNFYDSCKGLCTTPGDLPLLAY